MSQLEKCWEQEWVGIRKTETFSLATGNRPVWATLSHTPVSRSFFIFFFPAPPPFSLYKKTDQSSLG